MENLGQVPKKELANLSGYQYTQTVSEERWISTVDAAAILGITPDGVLKKIHRGEIVGKRFNGRSYQVDRECLKDVKVQRKRPKESRRA